MAFVGESGLGVRGVCGARFPPHVKVREERGVWFCIHMSRKVELLPYGGTMDGWHRPAIFHFPGVCSTMGQHDESHNGARPNLWFILLGLNVVNRYHELLLYHVSGLPNLKV